MRGVGSGIVSCLPYREGGRDLSWVAMGGYVKCLSASVTGPRAGEGGRAEASKESGEAGRVPRPLDAGRELGGDSRNREGSFGDVARCRGELGLEDRRDGVE